jgi:centromeric protein E
MLLEQAATLRACMGLNHAGASAVASALADLPPFTAALCSVSVRVRPLNKQEQSNGFAWRIENNSMQQLDPATREPEKTRDQKYTLDHIFGPKQSTRAIYEETTQGLIRKLVNGFNSTVFAYGQTSSGKTHTMRGTADEPGIIPMAVQEVFGLIESLQDREFLLRVSYMEVRYHSGWVKLQACSNNSSN